MSGVPYFNFPEFFRSEEFLINEGWQVLNPAKTTVALWGDFWKECIRQANRKNRQIATIQHKMSSQS